MARTVPALTAVLLALLAWAPPAAAQGIRRCVDAQGMSIFTDRPCSEMNAVPMEAPAASAGNIGSGFRGGFTQRGCARRPEELLDRVRSALEARDVNRLASHYHWTGTGSGSGKRLMDSLERIAKQPLVSAELIYPEPAPEPDYRDPTAGNPRQTGDPGPAWDTPQAYDNAPRYGNQPTPEDSPPPEAPAPAYAAPRHIRLLQMRSDQGEQATSTLFQLRRNAGCWWIEL